MSLAFCLQTILMWPCLLVWVSFSSNCISFTCHLMLKHHTQRLICSWAHRLKNMKRKAKGQQHGDVNISFLSQFSSNRHSNGTGDKSLYDQVFWPGAMQHRRGISDHRRETDRYMLAVYVHSLTVRRKFLLRLTSQFNIVEQILLCTIMIYYHNYPIHLMLQCSHKDCNC